MAVVLGSLLAPAGAMAASGDVPTALPGLPGLLSELNVVPGVPVRANGGPARLGAFGSPFTEPTIDGVKTAQKCLKGAGGAKICKPAAGTLNVLPGGRILYWNALEGTENNRYSIVTEGGRTFTNDATRLLDLKGPSWRRPRPVRGGANPNGAPPDPLVPGLQSSERYNDGALFGSHQTYLADGRLLVQGGTDYSFDPGVDTSPFGVVELGGLKSTRIYDPRTNRFTQTGDTNRGRWYPTLVPLGDGRVLDFSGVRKLLKPIYRDDPQNSGTNVRQVERFDARTGRWSDQGARAERSLPLYPRLHLLPDGKVFYNTSGQSYNPQGQSYDQATWNIPALYDPKRRSWSEPSGVPPLTQLTAFRGSTFSAMLPLVPNRDGSYRRASFLTAGGVLGFGGATSPGSYFPTRASKITSIDTAGGRDVYSVRQTGPLSQPRWYSSATVLPTGEVLATSGADKDEVVGPGTEVARQQAELFDPRTRTWRPVATAHNPRTYHNTAALLPDGRVLIGGHAPISTLYTNNTTIPGGFAPHDGRDPSFEIYRPPYLFRGRQPRIGEARRTWRVNRSYTVHTNVPAGQITKVVLIRYTATTHLVDGGQRNVELRIVRRGRGGRVVVRTPRSSNVLPGGPYMLFVVRRTRRGPVPSVARTVSVRPGRF